MLRYVHIHIVPDVHAVNGFSLAETEQGLAATDLAQIMPPSQVDTFPKMVNRMLDVEAIA